MGKQFEDFRQKRTETIFSTFQKTSVGHQDPKAINWISAVWIARIKKQNLKEGLHNKTVTVGALQD